MGITVNTSTQQITANVGETKIDVSVGGGVGPTGSQGSSGTVSVSAPITNAGTSTAAVIGLSVGTGLTVSGGSIVLPIATANDRGGVRIGSGVSIDVNGIISVSTNYAAATHSHAIGDVTGLQTALDGKQATLPNGNYLDLLSFNGSSWTNVAAADYATATGLVQAGDARLSDARTPLSHTHSATDLSTGIVSTARLGTGTATGATFLAGNGEWKSVVSTSIDGGSATTLDGGVLEGGSATTV